MLHGGRGDKYKSKKQLEEKRKRKAEEELRASSQRPRIEEPNPSDDVKPPADDNNNNNTVKPPADNNNTVKPPARVNLWPPPLLLQNVNAMTPLYHEWERGDILYWTSFDDNDANLEGYHVILNAVAMGVSEETTRLDKADGSGFLLDQYWVFNTVRLGSYQEIQTVDNITSEFVNNAVKTDNWTKNPNIINEVDGEFYKHIELIDIPDDAPPFVVYTDTARKMNDEQIKTFKEEYALAVAKRDADRKNQIYYDDDDDEDNDVVVMQSEEEEDDDDDDKDNDVEMQSEEEEEDREPMSFTLPFVGRAGLRVGCTATGSIQVEKVSDKSDQRGRLKDKFITSVNNIDVGKCYL